MHLWMSIDPGEGGLNGGISPRSSSRDQDKRSRGAIEGFVANSSHTLAIQVSSHMLDIWCVASSQCRHVALR